MDPPYDEDWEYDDENEERYPSIGKFMDRLKEINKVNNKKYEVNKFYIGSNSVFDRQWGHPTLTKAVDHARGLMEAQSKDEIFIVKIVRVVRRKTAPVEVIEIK